MKFSYSFAGNAPVIKKYQIGETWGSVTGIPAEIPTLSDTDGVLMCETTSCVDVVGVSADVPGARNTAQQTANADPATYVSLIVNPGVVYKAFLAGGATSGTALTALSNTVASTNGLLTTLALGTAYDDGYIWGATGANVRILRKVTAVGGTNETPIIAFPYDIAVGDTFYAATFGPGEAAGIQLTSALDEIDATADLQSTNNLRCVEFFQLDASEQDQGHRSYAEIVLLDHLFAGSIT